MHLFPVRHHSPRASRVLTEFLDTLQPELVLVEGPTDATPLMDIVADESTEPPVAILGFRTDGTPGSSLWPFASYSPEYVAIRWTKRHGRRAAFIDIATGTALAHQEEDDARGKAGDDLLDDEPLTPGVSERCAEVTGFRSFEEFWEASFEAPHHDVDGFRAALLAYADLVRNEDRRPFHRARDAFMRREIDAAIATGVSADKVVVVIGAAHAAALAAGDVEPRLEGTLPKPVPTSVTLIPYSFPRLAQQLGYGAGNRAPHFYQRAHDAGCDFQRATLEALITFTEHLRLRGFAASLADTIEAYRLAVTLAGMRGKAGPGLDEVREAAVATLCRGDGSHVDAFLWSTVVGKNVGRVASRIGRNALQEEFWREVRERRLPGTDAPENFTLRLNNDIEIGTSVFLHRLRITGIPYATFQGTRGMTGRSPKGEEAAGGFDALNRAREVWEAQWTPATDVGLVERIVFGNTLQDVAARLLDDKLQSATSTGAAADVLVESVIASCPQTLDAALAACERFAALDDDLPSLAAACRALSGLTSYGTSRARSHAADDAVPVLCRKTFSRAVLRLGDAAMGTDEAVAEVREAMRTLNDIALTQPIVDKTLWTGAAGDLVRRYDVNATASGLACGLLYLAQAIGDADIARIVGQRLSNTLEPERSASFLAGFLEVNALVIVKNRAVVEALDGFIQSIEPERFQNLLPTLRRAFADLGATERRYLLENVLAVRKIAGHAQTAQQVLGEKDKQKLKEMTGDLSGMLDELDDLL